MFTLLRVFLVDVGRNVQNGTNFNLTLYCVCGLSTSVIFPVIMQGEWCGCGCVCFLERCILVLGRNLPTSNFRKCMSEKSFECWHQFYRMMHTVHWKGLTQTMMFLLQCSNCMIDTYLSETCPREIDGFGLVWDITLPGVTAQQSCGAGKCLHKLLNIEVCFHAEIGTFW